MSYQLDDPGICKLFDISMHLKVRGEGVEPSSPGSKPGSLPVSRSPRVPCGNRTHVAGLEDQRLCRSAKGTKSGRRGSRTLKAHRSAVFGTAAIASWLALPLELRRQE